MIGPEQWSFFNEAIEPTGVSAKGRESISKTGSRELRKIFFFPAMAVMRKLLHNVFGVLKTQTPFQNYD